MELLYTSYFTLFLIILIPMVSTKFIAVYVMKLNILTLLGTLTGSMTSTPGLATVDHMGTSDAPVLAYATVYPMSMVLLIIGVQVLSLV